MSDRTEIARNLTYLNRAINYLTDQGKWNKFSWSDDEAKKRCILGAAFILSCTRFRHPLGFKDYQLHIKYDPLYERSIGRGDYFDCPENPITHSFAKFLGFDSAQHLADWNDSDSTNFEDVIFLLKSVKEKYEISEPVE